MGPRKVGRRSADIVEPRKLWSPGRLIWGCAQGAKWKSAHEAELAEADFKRRAYSFPRNILTTCRSAFSFRRYHRHCPCLLASTSPALVKIDIWWEMVGCDRRIFSSISPPHRQPGGAFRGALLFASDALPSFNVCRMRRRVGSAMAWRTRSSDTSEGMVEYK